MSAVTVAAVDLGASSGRVVLGRVGPDELSIKTVARFPNGPVERPDGLHWDLPGLFDHVLAALRTTTGLVSIGVDSWAVDYGLLRGGELLNLPWSYRDGRTDAGVAAVHARIGPGELYRRTGLQFLPFNTIYQLAAEQRLAEADRLLLVPDLVTWWLTGRAVCERTNASTTGLLDVHTGDWDPELLALVGVHPSQLPTLVDPGTVVGEHEGTPVVTVGSHDTASAVVGVPMTEPDAAYISCGTWGLVGVELAQPVVTEESRAANFTNEVGVDGTIRYLRNVMGLWILQECLRAWPGASLDTLLADAARLPAFTTVVDADDPVFLPPGDMPARIVEQCRRLGQRPPAEPAEFVRCVLDSLALAHRAALLDAQRLSGREVDVVHMVGGGSRNALLCQLTADVCGLPVEAGPTEATALGNVLIQARALGQTGPDLASMRALIRATHPTTRYTPNPTTPRLPPPPRS
jgi:rhamnulokinase